MECLILPPYGLAEASDGVAGMKARVHRPARPILNGAPVARSRLGGAMVGEGVEIRLALAVRGVGKPGRRPGSIPGKKFTVQRIPRVL